MKYIPSCYNLYFSVNEKKYVYNKLSTSICELENDIYNLLESRDTDSIPSAMLNDLSKEGLVVQDGTDEASIYEYYYNSARFGNGAGSLRITILPTYGCNLACPYCYQGQDKTFDIITDEKIHAINNFVKKQLNNPDVNTPISRIYVLFFGGEPTVAKDKISLACELLSKTAQENNVSIAFDITTNLTLIDEEFINTLKKYNFALQVTLDGTPEEHDKRRVYKNGAGTYNTIINNLKKLNNAGIFENITIRINIDEESAIHAEKIFDVASKNAKTVYFGYLKKYKSYNDDYKNTCIDRECFSAVATKKLNDIFSEHGIAPTYDFGKRGPCFLNSQNTYIFDPNLDVYKCEMLQNHPECKVGTLTLQGEFLPNKNFYQQMSFVPTMFQKCKKCSMLPLCGAGCPTEKYIRMQKKDGNILDSDCIFNDKILLEYLIDYVKRNS